WAQKEGKFNYVDALAAIVPWFFSLDHTSYAHWLSVRIRDLASLQCHPNLYAEFCAGNLAVHKMEKPVALCRWMVAGPEINKILVQFEKNFNKGPTFRNEKHHHKQAPGVQIIFTKEMCSLGAILEDLENPFMGTIGDLLAIHTNDIMPQEVVYTVQNIQKFGQEQYDTFVAEPITDALPKNKLPLFNRPHPISISKDKLRVCLQKCIFLHSLACLEKVVLKVYEASDIDAVILDGPVVVNYIKPGEATTFSYYACMKFLPHISHYLRIANQLDLVWDTYKDYSLKSSTRARCGAGIHRHVTADNKILSNRNIDFLRQSQNT
ncbi:hypothetical protein Hamer_G008001, partial [Homarus americanus]